MASGTIYGSYVNNWRLRIDYSYTQNIASNTSTMTSNLYVYDATGRSYNNSPNEAYYTIQGTKTYATFNFSSTGWYYLGSKTWTINHNSNGTASVTLTGNWYTEITSSYTPASLSISGTITLTTIPRASVPTVSASSCKMGESITIRTNKKSNFYHKITYQFPVGGTTYTSGLASTTGVVDSTTFTPPVSLASNITNTTNAKCRILLYTYSNSSCTSQIGSVQSVDFTLYIPDNLFPTISNFTVSVSNSNTTVNGWGVYLQGYSKLTYSITASGINGSTISKYNMSCEDIVNMTTQTGTSGIINSYGSFTPIASVTDTRGRTASYPATEITVYPYAAPSFTSCQAVRCDSVGISSSGGTYLKCNFNSNYSSVNGKNAYSIYASYRTSTGSFGTEVQISNGSVIGGGNIAVSNSYIVKFRIVDSLGQSSSKEISIFSEERPVNVKSNGRSIAIGKFAETDDLFDVAWKAKFEQAIDVGGNISFQDGKQTAERSILFANTSGTYPHAVKVYGGNPNNANAFGVYDSRNGMSFIQYADTTKTLSIGGTASGAKVVAIGDFSLSSDTDWTTINIGSGGSYVKYRRKCGIVYVVCNVTGAWTISNTYKTLATLPTEFRPSIEIPFTYNRLGTADSGQGAYVRTNGNIDLYNAVNATYFSFSVSFPV